MREEAGARYLSPSVKQDLAKLDTDGESRRFALKSLKQVIEQLDATSMPKFLSQVGSPCAIEISLVRLKLGDLTSLNPIV